MRSKRLNIYHFVHYYDRTRLWRNMRYHFYLQQYFSSLVLASKLRTCEDFFKRIWGYTFSGQINGWLKVDESSRSPCSVSIGVSWSGGVSSSPIPPPSREISKNIVLPRFLYFHQMLYYHLMSSSTFSRLWFSRVAQICETVFEMVCIYVYRPQKFMCEAWHVWSII